jgi:ribosomal protein S18 acetylase RimI-like enzyme
LSNTIEGVDVVEADVRNPLHMDDIVVALESYKSGEMGDSVPYTENEKIKLKKQFLQHSNALVFLVYFEGQIAGCSVCFTSFSTFSAGNVLNIHDFCIIPEYRSRGLGRRLLSGIVAKAVSLSCSKITLEVREDNEIAKKLYAQFAFKDTTPIMHFWTKTL